MARKKASDQAKLYTHSVRTRVTKEIYERLESLLKDSDSHSIGEIARRILSKEKIILFMKDASLDAPMAELSRVRKELNAIGVNINQITHHFHASQSESQRTFHALKVAEQYKMVGEKVDKLLNTISELAKKWLQK